MEPTPLHFAATERSGPVSALLTRPADAHCLLLLAHGAGAGMDHPFMESTASTLASLGVASLRYNFPFMEGGRGGPNPAPVLVETIRSAVVAATEAAPDLPLFAGGKSLGGRMTSTAAAAEPLPGVRGLVFLGFPLHAPGKPSRGRGDHLEETVLPLLFLQGTRDKLADLGLLEPLCGALGARATLHIVEGGDHSFAVLKRSGRHPDEVHAEIADTIAAWTRALV